MRVLIMGSSVLGLGAQLCGLVVGDGGLPLEAKPLGCGLLLGGRGVGGDRVGVTQPRLGELFGSLLSGFAARVLLMLGLDGGGRMLGLPLALGEGLLALGLGARRLLLLGGLAGGLGQLLVGFRSLGVGDGFVRDRGLAVAGLGLLELSLLDQVVLATHGAGHFLGLAGDAVEQSFAGFGCFVVVHVRTVPTNRRPTHNTDCDLRLTGRTGRRRATGPDRVPCRMWVDTPPAKGRSS